VKYLPEGFVQWLNFTNNADLNYRPFFLTPILILCSCIVVLGQTDYMKQWPQFRGPFASGIMEDAALPDSWNIHTGENILWQTAIPGLGHSCPIVWEDKLFVSTAISGSGNNSLKVGLYGDIDEVGDRSAHEFRLYCIDKHSGAILWERLAHQGVPRTERHTKASMPIPHRPPMESMWWLFLDRKGSTVMILTASLYGKGTLVP